MSRKSGRKFNKLFLCLGLIIALVSSSIPTVCATPEVNSLSETILTEGLEKDQNDMDSMITLVKDGLPLASVIVSVYSSDTEMQAAQELQSYIKKISGADLPIVNNSEDSQGIKIYIGSAAPKPESEVILAGGDEPESFRLHVAEGAIQLVGLSDKGVLYAAYELLEQMGVRWFMPGEIGTVIPASSSITVKIQDTIQHPGFITRLLPPVSSYAKHPSVPLVYNPTEGVDWERHNRLGGNNYGAHGFPGKPSNKVNPEWYIIENGIMTNQLDVTKPEVLQFTIEECYKLLRANPDLEYINISPNDGMGFGLTSWDEDDFDPMAGQISLTDRYIKFYNLVLEELQKEYPNVGLAFYAYSAYIRPPVREIPNPKILPVLAPISMERLHSIDNPLSWERNYFKEIIDGWQKLGVDVMYRGYLYNLAEPGLPFSIVPQVASEFEYFKENGINRMRIETAPSWGYHGPGLYLATKMMWNPDLDVEAALNDYYDKFYGPAAKPMKEHFKLLEKTFEEADYFAGSTNDFHNILTKNVMQKLEVLLRQAEEKVSADSVYVKRVNMIRIAFDFGDSFLEMLEANRNFDFIKAKENLNDVKELSLESISHSPVILYPYLQNFIQRFWGNKINEGYQRVKDGNKIIAELPDEWMAMLDPKGGGEALGLWKPELGTESWMPLKTYSETWSSQGLRYYYGHMWYRTSVKIPKEYEGKSIRLWLSDIDEKAKVWVNGKKLPVIKEGKPLQNPWEFDATEAVMFGKDNVIVIDVTNDVLNELGMGGIVGPGMFWAVNSEPDITPPSAPVDLTGVALSDSAVSLSWSPSTDNIGVSGYDVYRDRILLGTVNSTTFTDTGLNSGTAYSYTVKATDLDENISLDSNKVTVTTKFIGVVLQEDFEDGNANGWTNSKDAWSIISDEGNMVLRKNLETGSAVATAGNNEWENYTLELTIKPLTLTSHSTIQVYVRYLGSGDNYVFTYRHSTGKIELHKYVKGVSTPLGNVDFIMSPDTEYDFRVLADGNTLELDIDGNKVLTATDSSNIKGKISIKPTNTITQFDDVIVTAF